MRLRAIGGKDAGWPVTFATTEALQVECRLCVEFFRLDRRGLPVLTHPELGPIVVCYQCAKDLGTMPA